MLDVGSTYRGLRAMRWPHAQVRYGWRALPGRERGLWFHMWTPVWHEGRGPYVSIGLGFIAFCRGY